MAPDQPGNPAAENAVVGENPDAQDDQADEEEEENEEEDDAGGDDAADANNGAQGNQWLSSPALLSGYLFPPQRS